MIFNRSYMIWVQNIYDQWSIHDDHIWAGSYTNITETWKVVDHRGSYNQDSNKVLRQAKEFYFTTRRRSDWRLTIDWNRYNWKNSSLVSYILLVIYSLSDISNWSNWFMNIILNKFMGGRLEVTDRWTGPRWSGNYEYFKIKNLKRRQRSLWAGWTRWIWTNDHGFTIPIG